MTKLKIFSHFSNFKSLFLITFSCFFSPQQLWGTLHGVKAPLNLRIKYSLPFHNLVLGYAPFNRYLGSTILRRKSHLQRVFYLQFQHLQPELQINMLLHNFMLHSFSFLSLSFSFVLLTLAQTNEKRVRCKKAKVWQELKLSKSHKRANGIGSGWDRLGRLARLACIIFKSLNNWNSNNSNKKQRRRRRSRRRNYNTA